jgi:hypothetical protein
MLGQMRRIVGKRLGLVAAVAAFAAWLALGSSALASNHLIKIREVYPGDLTHTDAEYVELQMYAPGQNFFNAGTVLNLYGPTGTITKNYVTDSQTSNPPNSASQQRVIYMTASAETLFTMNVGFVMSSGDALSPAGGAVCYVPTQVASADCVSWGNFSGSGSLPSSTGGNVAAIPNGQAIGRSIAAGCPTLLEASDDSNQPSNWSAVTPNPLANSDTPPEHPCANTTLTKKPKAKTTDRTPTFKFVSSVNPATFKCNLDGKGFKPCSSPFTTKKLKLGKHTFKVRATAEGFTDPTPATARFKVIKKHR